MKREAALIMVLVALLAVPLRASADAPQMQINGHGVSGFSGGETIRFGLTAHGDEISATGQIEIRTIEPSAFGHWSIHGTIVCIQQVEFEGETLLELRYQMTRSDFPVNHPDDPQHPAGLPGAHASFYVKDAPTGDATAELTGTTEGYEDPGCGHGGAFQSLLASGEITITTRP